MNFSVIHEDTPARLMLSEAVMATAATEQGLGHAIAAAIMRTGLDPSKTADAVVAGVQKMQRGIE